MGTTNRRIEIFAPFGAAFDLTGKILFQPFDIAKWFVIGFAAWLATFFGGTSFNYRKAQNWNLRDMIESCGLVVKEGRKKVAD